MAELTCRCLARAPDWLTRAYLSVSRIVEGSHSLARPEAALDAAGDNYRVRRIDRSMFMARPFTKEDGAWIRRYWVGDPAGDNPPLWEIIAEGSTWIFGTDLRTNAHDVIRDTNPGSLPVLELSRVTAEMGFTLGHCAPLVSPPEAAQGTRRSVEYFMDFHEAETPHFLEALGPMKARRILRNSTRKPSSRTVPSPRISGTASSHSTCLPEFPGSFRSRSASAREICSFGGEANKKSVPLTLPGLPQCDGWCSCVARRSTGARTHFSIPDSGRSYARVISAFALASG